MIPTTITADHVRAGLKLIDRDGVPKGRHSRGYELVHSGKRYPPKYAVALAGKVATGSLLDSESFGGGVETNSFLKRLGFTVVAKGTSPTPTQSSTVLVQREPDNRVWGLATRPPPGEVALGM